MTQKLKYFVIPAFLMLLILGCSTKKNQDSQKSLEQLYAEACADAAKTPTAEDIFPLVNITQDSDSVTWNETKDKVLMVTWHNYPSSYPEKTEIKNSWGIMWFMSEAEIENWYAKNCKNIEDKELLFKQMIGLPPEKSHTTFSAVWVDPSKLYRPAYETDITKPMAVSFSEEFLATEKGAAFKEWLEAYAKQQYEGNPCYPWSRLGYTYNWSGKGTKYGFSEFCMDKNNTMTVEFTKSNEEYFKMLDEKSK